jgi:alpha(1,3/1,4) fucosyltransferase
MNFPNKVPTKLKFDFTAKNKLCSMIIENKFNFHPLELYTERVKAIRWFEKNHPEDFDLHGINIVLKTRFHRLKRSGKRD